MSKEKQPAKKSYFFDQGFRDMVNAIKTLWILNAQMAQKYNDIYKRNGLLTVKGMVFSICAISVVIFGTIFFAGFTLVFVSFLVSVFLLMYIGFTLIWLWDRTYLYKNKIFTACNECKEKSLIPTYLCPKCGANHTYLTPGVYGILKRTCNCGEKLPTGFFNGRRDLKAMCPKCGSTLSDRESVPICIPIIGGRSVGKTAFITAFSTQFIEKIAPDQAWNIDFYNDTKSNIYKEISTDYASGRTRMTDRPQDVKQTSSVSFSFFVKGKHFKPERLVHIYDIAGEVFTDNAENEVQKQYEYCQGIVLIIDPFSIPSVRYKYEKGLKPEDIAGIGKADINGIANVFLSKLRDVTGLSDNKLFNVPLAVVISKTDSGALYKEFSNDNTNEVIVNNPELNIDPYDAKDYICREFLINNGMESFVNLVNLKFKNNRYFSCSAIGHVRDAGKYTPQGVIEPMQWLFQQADKKMGKYWNDKKFNVRPIALQNKTIKKLDVG